MEATEIILHLERRSTARLHSLGANLSTKIIHFMSASSFWLNLGLINSFGEEGMQLP